MKLKVYIDAAGMEAIALGRPLYNWNYSVYPADAEKDASLKVFVIQKGASHLNITAQRYLE